MIINPKTNKPANQPSQDKMNQEFIQAFQHVAQDVHGVKTQLMTMSLMLDYLCERLQVAKTPEGTALFELALQDFPAWAKARTDEMKAELAKMQEEPTKTDTEINLDE